MDDTEFYSKINKSVFDAAIQMMSSKVLADLVKLLLACDINGRSFRNTRPLITMASMKLTQRMIDDMKSSFGDVDEFLNTGKLPDYMQDVPQAFREAMEKAARKMRESKGQ